MTWKSIIPFAGDKTVHKKLRELDKEFVSVILLIGIGFSKIFEGWVGVAEELWPITVLGVDISSPVWWTIYTLMWTVVFIYEINEKAKEAADEAVEAADEIADEASELIEGEE